MVVNMESRERGLTTDYTDITDGIGIEIEFGVPLLARPAVPTWYPVHTAGRASSGTHLLLLLSVFIRVIRG